MKKNNNKLTNVLIVVGIVLLLLNFKSCEVDNNNELDERLNARAFGGGGRIFSSGFTSLSIFVDMVPDWDCVEACTDIWLPCFDVCDELYCDPYYECRTACQEEPEGCWEMQDCRDEAMNTNLECYLDCGFDYDDARFLCDDDAECLEDIELDLTACQGNCHSVYLVEYQECYNEYHDDCSACLDDCGDDCENCEMECELGAEACIVPDCIIGEGEVYLWDGEPVGHVGDWFEESFPTFYDEFEELCNSDYFDGTFVSIANTMGCTDADLFYYGDCTDAPLLSAQEVCETIGGTWSCYPDAGCDSHDCEEPNAVLMCEK